MRRISIASIAGLLVLLSNIALADAGPACQVLVANISNGITRLNGTVTANVTGIADFLQAGDQISVSGVTPDSFNGGPFTLTSASSTQLQWQQPGNDATGGNGTIFPALGTASTVVQFSGNSAQFTVAPVSDPSNGYTFSYGSMAEITTPNGSAVKGRTVNISGNNFGWSQPYTNGTYTLVRLCGAFPVDTGFVTMSADHFVYFTAGTAQNSSGTLTVPADSIKFNLDMLGWPFALYTTDRLQVQMRIKVPSHIEEVDIHRDETSGSITQLNVTLRDGPGLQLSFPLNVGIDNSFVPASFAGYFVDAKVSDTGIDLFLNFPPFYGNAGVGLDWDPLIQLVQ